MVHFKYLYKVWSIISNGGRRKSIKWVDLFDQIRTSLVFFPHSLISLISPDAFAVRDGQTINHHPNPKSSSHHPGLPFLAVQMSAAVQTQPWNRSWYVWGLEVNFFAHLCSGRLICKPISFYFETCHFYLHHTLSQIDVTEAKHLTNNYELNISTPDILQYFPSTHSRLHFSRSRLSLDNMDVALVVFNWFQF